MIAFLRGEVFQVGAGFADIDVNGVGYRVWMTDPALAQLSTGDTIRVFTYYHVREDAILLFGFLTDHDRDWFELLISVSGVGPKSALQLMSASSANAFLSAIAADDVAYLCTLPGVGKKTAQRFVVELKDKVNRLAIPFTVPSVATDKRTSVSSPLGQLGDLGKDIVEALVVLGYNERQAADVAQSVLQEEDPGSVEDGIKFALRRLVG